MARSLTVISLLLQSTTYCRYRVYTKFLLTYTAIYRRNRKVLPLGITALQPQSHFHLGTPYNSIPQQYTIPVLTTLQIRSVASTAYESDSQDTKMVTGPSPQQGSQTHSSNRLIKGCRELIPIFGCVHETAPHIHGQPCTNIRTILMTSGYTGSVSTPRPAVM
jgi:hypothetical protein